MSAPARLAVLGFPLSHTRSPDLHRAAAGSAGRAIESEALVTRPEELGRCLAALARAGAVGCNLTMPLKEPALAIVGRPSELARRSRSINTIGFAGSADPADWWGDTTDGPGFLDLLAERGREPRAQRVVLLGAGGASRSLAVSLRLAGARVMVSARRPDEVADRWPAGVAERVVAWRSADEAAVLRDATVVVNGTPLHGDEWPVGPGSTGPEALCVDLTYGEQLTPWVSACRAAGREAVDGLGLLVHQARRSLSLWFGHEIALEPLARAVGWPR